MNTIFLLFAALLTAYLIVSTRQRKATEATVIILIMAVLALVISWALSVP